MTENIQQLGSVLFWATAGLVLAFPLIKINIRFAANWGLLDWPKARGLNEVQVPIVGSSLVVISLAALGLLSTQYDISPWFLTTASLMAIVGFLDDRKPLSALEKIFFQILCVSVIVLWDPHIHESVTKLYGPWGTFWAGFFILGLMNAINFIDGIDGLAGVVLVFGSLGYILFSRMFPEQQGYFIYSSLLLGMMVPFLYFNVLKREAFLGNVGSYFFSYLLATMHVSLPIESSNSISRIAISGLCFLVPIADSVMVLITRLSSFRSPFHADKGHLHHRLVQTTLPLRQILAVFACIEAMALLIGVALVRHSVFKDSWLPFLCVLSQGTIVGLLISLIERTARQRVRSSLTRMDHGEPLYFQRYKIVRKDGLPVTPVQMRRLEAKISAEIRITEMCFTDGADTLTIILRSLPESLKGVSNRVDTVFHVEKVQASHVCEQGQYIKQAEVRVTPKLKSVRLRKAK